jgi:hypothetical protein
MPRIAVGRLQVTLDAFTGGRFVLFLTGPASDSAEALAAARLVARHLPLVCWAICADRHFHAGPADDVIRFPDSAAMHDRLGGLVAVLCRPDGYVLATDVSSGLPNALASVRALMGQIGAAGTEPARDDALPAYRTI